MPYKGSDFPYIIFHFSFFILFIRHSVVKPFHDQRNDK
jgi:hypothetical protein